MSIFLDFVHCCFATWTFGLLLLFRFIFSNVCFVSFIKWYILSLRLNEVYLFHISDEMYLLVLRIFRLEWLFRHLAAPWIRVCVCMYSLFLHRTHCFRITDLKWCTNYLTIVFFFVCFVYIFAFFITFSWRRICASFVIHVTSTLFASYNYWQFSKIFKKNEKKNQITPVVSTPELHARNLLICHWSSFRFHQIVHWTELSRQLSIETKRCQWLWWSLLGSDYFFPPILASFKILNEQIDRTRWSHAHVPAKQMHSFHGSALKQSEKT